MIDVYAVHMRTSAGASHLLTKSCSIRSNYCSNRLTLSNYVGIFESSIVRCNFAERFGVEMFPS